MPGSAYTTADRLREAALHALTVHGYAGMSMEAVRRAAGVSNGSLYHHFPSRADLAAHLLLDGMTRCQEQILLGLAAAADARAGVCGVVEAQLGWVEAHADLARLLYGDLPDDVLLAAEPAFSKRNRAYVKAVSRWLDDQAAGGTLRDLPFGVAHALWLGPAQEFCRHWLRGRSRVTPTQATDDLANGAWRALAKA
jgi:AcrR family transcriptional regulator